MVTTPPVVLVLGAGINGCALARELAINGVSTWVVDSADIAAGATSGSSRLIHGGLRYLEYGELDLVKESLAERTRLLRLAPQFVHPLRLWIPCENRLGGAVAAVGRFFGWRHWPAPKRSRGALLVRAGLRFYDAYARDPDLPPHQAMPLGAPGTPAVNRDKYRWLCAYYDAQVSFPERLSLALLEDAREISQARGLDFRVLTYHRAERRGRTVEITPLSLHRRDHSALAIEPAAIVNATGAWVDETLQRLHVHSTPLMGCTKGSHLFTFNARLLEILSGQGIYAEASDGRPIFITPLVRAVLVGTTDICFNGPPEQALASEQELEYLLAAVNSIVPAARLTRADVAFHYSAVRPLPRVTATTPAAITRRHAIVANSADGVPLISLVGGKLTTMRSLAESAAAAVLQQMDRSVIGNSRDRGLPGGQDYPPDTAALEGVWQRISDHTGYCRAAVAEAWKLCGTRTEACLQATPRGDLLPDTDLPCAVARQSIQLEWAVTLADLVERRLMLLYHQRLSRACLRRLAQLLAESGGLAGDEVETAVAHETARLAERYGRHVD